MLALDVPYRIPPFARQCLDRAADSWQRASDHPFVRALAEGALAAGKFRFYQMQDARYLERYADACALIAARCREPDESLWFVDAARRALVTERSLHLTYGKRLGYDRKDIASLELTPNNRAYQDHLISCVQNGSMVEAVAAVTPCPWLYREIGRDLHRSLEAIPPEHDYADWLRRYSDPELDENVEGLLGLLQRYSEGVDEQMRDRAAQAFETSVRYEWMFWEQAWKEQAWPVP